VLTLVSVILFSSHKYRIKLSGLAAANAERWFVSGIAPNSVGFICRRPKDAPVYRYETTCEVTGHDHEYGVSASSSEVLEAKRKSLR